MLIFKLRHDIDGQSVVRAISFETNTPAWNTIATKIQETYFIPVPDVAIAYVDEEGDRIVLSSQTELNDYYTSPSFCSDCYNDVRRHSHGKRCTMKLNVIDLADLRQIVQSKDRTPSLMSA